MAQIESYNPERSLAEGGRSRRGKNMAESTPGPGPEGVESTRGSFATVPGRSYDVAAPEIRIRDWLRSRGVMANASLGDQERLQTAQKSLGTQLTPKQEEAVLKAHQAGSGEPGKDHSQAGIYNYTQAQVREKAEILKEAGFNREQRRALIELGIVGTLSPDEFASFNESKYKDDDKLAKIAKRIKTTGAAGRVDERFLYGVSAQIKRLTNEIEVDPILAQDILDALESWQTKADDSLLPHAERVRVEEQARREGGSRFSMVKAYYEYYSTMDTASFSSTQQAELQRRNDRYGTEIQTFVNEARRLGILVDVDNKALSFYNRIRGARRREKYGGMEKQALIDSARRGQSAYGYQEYFWDDSLQLKRLEGEFRGVAEYVWEGLVGEIDKEANNKTVASLNVVATAEFERLKNARRIARAKEKKYEISIYYGRRTPELIAENAEELSVAVLDWVGDQIAELSKDPGMAQGQIDKIRQEAVEMLETNRFYLEKEEGQDISPTHPDFLRARNIAEAATDVLGNEMMLYKGGDEIGPQYKKRFASEFIAHHDAIYLENPYVAYIMHRLTKSRNGTYWLGQSLDSEKLSEGEIEDYRRIIEEEVKEDAFTHELFISEEDFRKRKAVGPDGKNTKDLSYSFDDPIERLLLDLDDSVWKEREAKLRQENTTQADITAAKNRRDIRVRVFRAIKERLDREEKLELTPQKRQQMEQQLGRALTAQELLDAANKTRKEKITKRILQQMDVKSRDAYVAKGSKETKEKLQVLDEAKKHGSPEYDEIIWKWVEDYNKYRIKLRLPRWQPSGWDRVRMRIDRPTKVLDRVLSEEEFEAMYEPIVLPAGFNYEEDIQTRKRTEDVRFGFQLARSYQIFTMQDTLQGGMRTRLIDKNTGQYTGRLMDYEASRVLGMIDQNGDVTNPNRKLVRVFDIVQARLEAAITEEAVEIAQAKTEKAQAIASGNQDAIQAAVKDLRNKLVNAQFLATHALKEIGLVEGKLPVWSYNFLDDSTLDVFMKDLADYGVETAENIPISHEDKGLFYEIIERGRRALKSEWDRATQEHMSSSYKVLARNPDGTYCTEQARSLWRAADDFGLLGKGMTSRYRMVSKGAVAEDRKVTDTRFEQSTSGGVAVTELIPDLADLGFYPLLVWLGVTDARGFHGYIHRRDETEFHKHRYFHVMDPVQHADSLGAAYKAIKGLTGGKIDEGTSSPGVLKEPFHGAFKVADWLHKQYHLAHSYGMHDTGYYLDLMISFRKDKDGSSYTDFLQTWKGNRTVITNEGAVVGVTATGADLEKYRQLSYSDLDKLSREQSNDFYSTMYNILDYFQIYLKALKTVETSRRSRAPRNWEENNHLKWYAFRREMRKAMAMGEKGFIMKLGYSPEVASEIAIRMMEIALQDGDYLILKSYEVKRRVLDGVDILSKVLTEQEKRHGWVIPDEKDWSGSNIRPEVQKALKTIRRRGLLEFMREEGYNLLVDNAGEPIKNNPIKNNNGTPVAKTVLGRKIPPLVQEEEVKKSPNTKVYNAYIPIAT